MDENRKYNLYIGDALTVLKSMPDQYVNCWVTSPPYWGLRDYGVEGQLGLEKTPEEYVAKLVEMFREARRVLRDDGTLWLNLGDTYTSTAQGTFNAPERIAGSEGRLGLAGKARAQYRPFTGCKPKDIVGIPWLVALALRADGWYLRQDIIWHKPNPMPESVKDRCTKAHEYIFLLSKSERYYYDQDAIKEPASPDTHARYARGRSTNHKWADGGPGNQTIAKSFEHMRKPGVNPKAAANSPGSKQNSSFSAAVKDIVEERNKRTVWTIEDHNQLLEWLSINHPEITKEYFQDSKHSIWTVPTHPFPQAHFATFPPALIEPCILAGCPEGGIVGDMFAGSATTGEVALKLFRRFVGIELSPTYANEIAIPRIESELCRPKQCKLFS